MINNEFLNIYEKLTILNEAKQDTLNFKNFFMKNGYSDSDSDDIVSRFNKIKLKLKGSERDYYYWMKKNPQEVLDKINSTEQAAIIKKASKERVTEGATLVNETDHWKIYHITNFEASKEYGRDTKWCITGLDSGTQNYWNSYISRGYTFYFLITKENYDQRGSESKFALAVHNDTHTLEIFDQQDNRTSLDRIPYNEEIEIPGINIRSYNEAEIFICDKCGANITEDEIWMGEDGNIYCETCWNYLHFICPKCEKCFLNDDAYEGADGNWYCGDCWAEEFFECENCGRLFDNLYLNETEAGEYLCPECYKDLYEEGE